MSEPAARVAYLQYRVSRLRRRLWLERVVFLALILGLFLLLYRQKRISQAYLLTVGQQQVAVMGSLLEAEQAIDLVKRAHAPGWPPEEVDFQPELTLSPITRGDMPYSSPRAAARAIARTVQLMVPSHGIQVNGRVLVCLRTKQEAQRALSDICRHYPHGETGARFVEKVRVVHTRAPVTALANARMAYRILAAPACRYHTVRPDDTVADICHRYALTRARLATLNPTAHLDALRPGTRLLVARSDQPPVTVQTRSERYLNAPIPCPVERTQTAALPPGTTRVVRQGVPGLGKYLVRTTYHNGREVRQERILQEVLRPPTPSKLLVGN